jgi:uncharacterized membrane protein YtjA (UPF0391 family)
LRKNAAFVKRRRSGRRNFFGERTFFPNTWLARRNAINRKGFDMLGWALTFLVVAIIAAVLGFGGIAGMAVEAAKIVFFVAILLFAISAIVGLVRGRSPTVP